MIFGGIASVIGAVLPEVIRDLTWSYSTAGLVMVANSTGYFVSTFLSGLMSQRLGFRTLACGGLLLQAAGLGLFGARPEVFWNLLTFIILGCGQGMTEVSTNCKIVQIERPGTSRLMNLVHSAFTIGAIAAPVATGILFKSGQHWRTPFLVFSGICMIMMLCFLTTDTRKGEGKTNAEFNWNAFKTLSGHPVIHYLFLIIMVYVGAEIGISSWISELFVSHHQTSVSMGAWMVSLFWGGIFVGRIFVATGYGGSQPAKSLFLYSLFSLVSLALALAVQNATAAAILFFATGLGFSTIYPTGMSIIGKVFDGSQGPAIGVVSTGGGVGVCIFPYVMASVSSRHGLIIGFTAYLILACIMTGLAWRLSVLLKK